MSHLPIICITMGDPSGVGPEIIGKALSDPGIYTICRPLVVGDYRALAAAGRAGGKRDIRAVTRPNEMLGEPGVIDLLPVSGLREEAVIPGRPTVEGGRAMVSYIEKAVELIRSDEAAALVTCPINKALMHEAGYSFDGHTELLAALTRTDDYVMMLAGERLRVALVTIHCALREVAPRLDEALIYKTITITARAMKDDFGFSGPRIAVAALNPHAGEAGLFGREEEAYILPAIKRARLKGLDIVGPLPADTLFYQAVSGRYDAVVAMYHDQGLIPLKLLHFADGVNITLGLPIIRTSVDHGTAYDIAGKDLADASSLKAAIRMAVEMVRNRTKHK